MQSILLTVRFAEISGRDSGVECDMWSCTRWYVGNGIDMDGVELFFFFCGGFVSVDVKWNLYARGSNAR